MKKRIEKKGGEAFMSQNKKTPEHQQEELRQEEAKQNPAGNVNDAMRRAETGGFAELAGSLGWKGLGILLLVIIIGIFIAALFIK